VDIVFDTMVQALRAGDEVEIRGFGSFHARQRQGRIARNPKTGARVKVLPKRIAYFRVSKEVLAVLNHQAPTSLVSEHREWRTDSRLFGRKS